MNIVKGDTVYIRAGKDVAGKSRLRDALGIKDEEKFRETIAKMPMSEQIAKANEELGVRGKVLRVMAKDGKLVVEGMNMVTKHQRPRGTAGAAQVQQGGRIQMEAPLPLSRVMLVCSNCDKPTRVGSKVVEATRQTISGPKTVQVRERVCKQCGQVIARPTDG